jgi:hypothetical protein
VFGFCGFVAAWLRNWICLISNATAIVIRRGDHSALDGDGDAGEIEDVASEGAPPSDRLGSAFDFGSDVEERLFGPSDSEASVVAFVDEACGGCGGDLGDPGEGHDGVLPVGGEVPVSAGGAGSSSDVAVPLLDAFVDPPPAEAFLVLPGGHTITWYPYGRFKVMCKHLGHVRCTKERVSSPGRRLAQGRPIGFLLWWLSIASDHVNAFDHMRIYDDPTVHERYVARTAFVAIIGSAGFLNRERAKREDEDSEPEDCP